MSPRQGPPLVIGLLGGIAAGKTTVAGMLARLGARVVSADAIARALLHEPAVRHRIAARWGDEVLGVAGQVNPQALARRVFGHPEALAALEAITHPAILTRMREQIATAQATPDVAAIVVDAPLLLEAELDRLCDLLVFVDCPHEVRAARVAAERGWDADELGRREAHQQPLDTKRERARFVVNSNTAPETTFEQVQALWQEALGL